VNATYRVGVWFAARRPPRDDKYREVEVIAADSFAGSQLARLTAAQMVAGDPCCVMPTRTEIQEVEL
jgi:hypothetical protein